MTTLDFLGTPAKRTTLRPITWLRESRAMSIVWLAARVWLGIMWLQAGIAKIWGAENPDFLHNGGAGVAGFAGHGVPAYSWWGSFLHSFVVPNAGWIAVLVAFSEFAIGCLLVAGLFTRVASLASLVLLFTYIMSGTASVCAFYAAVALLLLVMWRTAGYLGADGVISGWRQRRAARVTDLTVTIPDVLPAEFTATHPTPAK